MPRIENKLFEYTDSHGTTVGLVEVVAGWSKDVRIRISGVEVTNRWSNRETTESVSTPIKSPEELADFVTLLQNFLGTSCQECDFSLGPHGRDCGTLIRRKGEPTTWRGLKGRVSGSRYGFHVDEGALRALLDEAARYE